MMPQGQAMAKYPADGAFPERRRFAILYVWTAATVGMPPCMGNAAHGEGGRACSRSASGCNPDTQMIVLLVGKSAAGKDSVAEKLEGYGLRSVISHTTRPQRSADDTRHVFVSDTEADALIGEAVATTVINGYRYFATKSDMEIADLYTIDPNGIEELLGNMPDAEFGICYIDSDDIMRRKMAISRADDPILAARVFDERDTWEAADFAEFVDRMGRYGSDEDVFPPCVVGCVTYWNDYRPDTLDEIARAIKDRFFPQV